MMSVVDGILTSSRPLESAYLIALRDKTLSKAEFLETQQQFFHAVAWFPRPMAALAARIPSTEVRASLMRNLWEEHGSGDASQFHTVTFKAFLARLGVGVSPSSPWPEVHAFNVALMGTCTADHPATGLAALGMVERIFTDISAFIGSTLVKHGWLPSEHMVHYAVHQALDVRHAQDLFDAAATYWPAEREHVNQGLALGAHVFMRLYDGLYHARGRRG